MASESASGGFGRANDPLVLLAIRQDILEGKARTPQEARGGDDHWPGRASYYWYGGLFNTWLRETYGAERYAKLWREFGKGDILTGSDGFLFLPGAFKTVYGRSLEDAWDDFLAAAAYQKPVITAVRKLWKEPGSIAAVASRGDDLYWGDYAAGSLFRRDGSSGVVRAIKRADGTLTGVSAKQDSPELLLSEGTYTNSGQAVHLHVRVWDEATGAYVGPEMPGSREAAWMEGNGNAFAAIGIRGSFSDLVLVRDGQRETLLEGSYDRQIGSPAPMEDGRIAFVLWEKGTTRIARMDPASRLLEVLDTDQPLGFIRNLSSTKGGLAFSWATREDFPSLGLWDRSGGLRLQKVALSGGVTLPRTSASGVYYIGRFSDGMHPCSYPWDAPALALEPVASRWIPRELPQSDPAGATTPSHPYSGLPFLVPFVRFPFPKIGPTGLEGMGIGLVAADDIETWELTALADYDWTRTFADVSLLLQLGPPSSTITVGITDAASWDPVESHNVRALSGSLGATYLGVAPDASSLSIGLVGSVTALAPETPGVATAYAWPFASVAGAVGAVAGYNGRIPRSIDPAVLPTGPAFSLAVDAAAPLEAPLLPGLVAQTYLGFTAGTLGLTVDAWAAATLPGVPQLAALAFYPAGIYRNGAISGHTGTIPGVPGICLFRPCGR